MKLFPRVKTTHYSIGRPRPGKTGQARPVAIPRRLAGLSLSGSDEHAEIEAEKAKATEDEGKASPGLCQDTERYGKYGRSKTRQGCNARGRWRIRAPAREMAPINKGKGPQADAERNRDQGDRRGRATPPRDGHDFMLTDPEPPGTGTAQGWHEEKCKIDNPFRPSHRSAIQFTTSSRGVRITWQWRDPAVECHPERRAQCLQHAVKPSPDENREHSYIDA